MSESRLLHFLIMHGKSDFEIREKKEVNVISYLAEVQMGGLNCGYNLGLCFEKSCNINTVFQGL